MLANSPIRNNIEKIGFLLIITNMAHKIATNEIISNVYRIQPLVYISFIKNNLFI